MSDGEKGGGNAVTRIGSLAAAPLTGLPRATLSVARDLRSVAEAVQVLPQVAAHLAEIAPRVVSIDREVSEMRRGVDSLDARMDYLNTQIDSLEQRLEELPTQIRPLRGLFGRAATPDRPRGEPR